MNNDYGQWDHDRALKYARRAYTADENDPDAIYCYAKAILYYEQITYENGALLLFAQIDKDREERKGYWLWF